MRRVSLQTFITDADLLLSVTSEVDDSHAISVDVQQVNAWAEVVHQGAQSPGIDCPVVYGFIFVKLGVHWSLGFEGQVMCRRDSWSTTKNVSFEAEDPLET